MKDLNLNGLNSTSICSPMSSDRNKLPNMTKMPYRTKVNQSVHVESRSKYPATANTGATSRRTNYSKEFVSMKSVEDDLIR